MKWPLLCNDFWASKNDQTKRISETRLEEEEEEEKEEKEEELRAQVS